MEKEIQEKNKIELEQENLNVADYIKAEESTEEKIEETIEEYEAVGTLSTEGYDTVIASLWYGLNYGSIISAFALYKTVEKMGKKPVLLSKPADMWTGHYDNPDSIAGRFILKNCHVASREITEAELNKCNYFLAGSDVLWNYDICGNSVKNTFVGDFADAHMKRISCASSFGKVQGGKMKQSDILEMKKNILKFTGLSVRDSYDAGICQNIFGTQSEIILDPVFLCDMEEYKKVIRTAHFDAKEPYIFTYIEKGNDRIKRYIEDGMRIQNKVSRNYIDINRFPESSKELGLDVTFHVMADDWLCSIWNSDFVVTDSYYGVCFAILFHKSFAVVTSSDFRSRNQIKELLSWFELEERLVPCDEYSDMNDYKYLFRKKVNWARTDKKLEQMRTESLKWLEECFNK